MSTSTTADYLLASKTDAKWIRPTRFCNNVGEYVMDCHEHFSQRSLEKALSLLKENTESELCVLTESDLPNNYY